MCDTKDVEQAGLTFEKECKDVTAKVCAPTLVHPIGYATVEADCKEVTKQVCINKPKKVTKTVPVTSCQLKTSVDCKPVKSKIPKRVCEEVVLCATAALVVPVVLNR